MLSWENRTTMAWFLSPGRRLGAALWRAVAGYNSAPAQLQESLFLRNFFNPWVALCSWAMFEEADICFKQNATMAGSNWPQKSALKILPWRDTASLLRRSLSWSQEWQRKEEKAKSTLANDTRGFLFLGQQACSSSLMRKQRRHKEKFWLWNCAIAVGSLGGMGRRHLGFKCEMPCKLLLRDFTHRSVLRSVAPFSALPVPCTHCLTQAYERKC